MLVLRVLKVSKAKWEHKVLREDRVLLVLKVLRVSREHKVDKVLKVIRVFRVL